MLCWARQEDGDEEECLPSRDKGQSCRLLHCSAGIITRPFRTELNQKVVHVVNIEFSR